MTSMAIVDQIRTYICEYRDSDSPVTLTLIGVVIGVFLVEIWFGTLGPAENIEVFATGIFGVAPEVAWPFAPFLHQGFLHFTANCLGLFILGYPIEQVSSSRWYLIFVATSAYGSIVGGAVILHLFSDQQVAFYGISGIVFALSGYALVRFFQKKNRRESENASLLIGISALLLLLIDFASGPYFTPRWVNGGHISGFMIGITAEYIQRKYHM